MNGRPSFFDTIKQTPNLTSGLIDLLVERIVSGELAPGQRLPTEQAIVSATGVSRTVVREALASLRARGLITTRQGLGAFVSDKPISKTFSIVPEELESIPDILHVLELRMSVEVEAAALAAARRDAGDLKRIEIALGALEEAIGAAAPGAEEDFAFHRAILEATHNPYFARFIDVFGASIIPRQRVRLGAMPSAKREAYLRRIQKEHEAIFAAILAGDAAASRRAARAHLTKSYERYAALREQAGTVAPEPLTAHGRG
ncbi:FadR/GntR family transcriptional regulator [Labrys monachus]|uniref:DNA-binding FadR family transcriptional regulator n=1 Tax=Labrys monachus TaxID=217067 RepID=A0ABU0FA59_9HYPH|nr:FCD domain-containing protein [Labrys monachus]MDQ0391510.1 DNA-binding FadR family transcriptional regulator [Labrys monachus]